MCTLLYLGYLIWLVVSAHLKIIQNSMGLSLIHFHPFSGLMFFPGTLRRQLPQLPPRALRVQPAPQWLIAFQVVSGHVAVT